MPQIGIKGWEIEFAIEICSWMQQQQRGKERSVSELFGVNYLYEIIIQTIYRVATTVHTVLQRHSRLKIIDHNPFFVVVVNKS